MAASCLKRSFFSGVVPLLVALGLVCSMAGVLMAATTIPVTPPGGTYSVRQSVFVNPEVLFTDYVYTLDGSDPDANSPRVWNGIGIMNSATLKIRSYDLLTGALGPVEIEQYVIKPISSWSAPDGEDGVEYYSGGIGIDGQGGLYSVSTKNNGFSGGLGKITLTKRDVTHTILWQTTVIVDAQSLYETYLATDSTGNSYVVTTMTSDLEGTVGFGREDILVLKFDANGNRLWLKRFGTASQERVTKIALGPDGSLHIAGRRDGSAIGTGQDCYLLKISAEGVEQWTQRQVPVWIGSVQAVAVDPAGFVYTVLDSNPGYPLNKYDSAGNLLWSVYTNVSQPRDVAISNDGKIIYVLNSKYERVPNSTTEYYDVNLSGYGVALGNLLWSKPVTTEALELPSAMAVDAAGLIYVTGSVVGALDGYTSADGNLRFGKTDMFAMKFDPSANLLSSWQIGGASEDLATSVKVDGAGNLFVGGNAGNRGFDGWNHLAFAPLIIQLDNAAPVLTMTSPQNGTSLLPDTPITVRGTALDDISGAKRVEVSTDGGISWLPAQGTNTWSYVWTPGASGFYTLKARALDIPGNQSVAASITVAVDDGLAPKVVTTYPSSTQLLPIMDTMQVTFSESISIVDANAIVLTKGKTLILCNKSANDSKLSIDPVVNLAKGATYTLTIPKGAVMDMAGIPLATSYTLTFTTAKR